MMSRRHNSHLVTYGLQVKWAGGGQAGRRRQLLGIHADTTETLGSAEVGRNQVQILCDLY